MKAALCTQFGDPDDITIEDIAEPEPAAGEVVIRVHAAALNFYDTLLLRDRYQYSPPLPFSPSGEVAGVIESMGPDVTGFEAGQRVMAYIRWNGCREKVAVRADALIPIPEGVSDEVASGVSVTYGTAIHGLKDRGHVREGQSVAVLGASGGAGLAAVEIAKAMGARVIAAASSADKLAVCKRHGADELIDYAAEDLKTRLKELTGGDGVDVVYDCVGGPYAEAALRATGWEGRFLVVGFASGEIPKMPLNLALLKGCDIVGVFWNGFTEREPARNRSNIEDVLQWCATGALEPRIHGTFALADTVKALKIIAAREATGKIVIRP